VRFHILSGDLIGVPAGAFSGGAESDFSAVCVRVSLGGGGELGCTRAKHGRTPIWNELLDIWIPSATQVFGVPAPTSIVLELVLNDNSAGAVLATISLSLADDIFDTESIINDPEFGRELVLSEPIPKGKKVARLVVKIDVVHAGGDDSLPPRQQRRQTNADSHATRDAFSLPGNVRNGDHRGRSDGGSNPLLPALSPGSSPERQQSYGHTNPINAEALKSDSHLYLERLRDSMAQRSEAEAARCEQDKIKTVKRKQLAAKRRKRRLAGKKTSMKYQLSPGPASYGSLASSLTLNGGRFSTANPKSFLDWSAYFGAQTPSPQDYGFGDRRPVTSGGRFNTSKPKSEIDWVRYHSSQVPGPFEYAPDIATSRKLPGGGRISEARPKSAMDWIVYHSREIPAPNAYAAPQAPKINGGRFSNARPKSEIDWVVYRSQQTPSPNEYGDGGRPATSGGKFNSSNPKSQLDWVTYFAKKLPGAADYSLPEGASSDYFTVPANQSRPPGLNTPLYGSGVGSVRFPRGGGHSREGRWKKVAGGQVWTNDNNVSARDQNNTRARGVEEGTRRRRRRRRRRRKLPAQKAGLQLK
jgi:hypothetical protein